MELAAAKMIGAGLACIALVGAGIGIGNVYGSYLSGALRNPGAAATQTTNLLLGFALCEATGQRQDPCVLDTFMAATDFMRGAPAAPWWHYTPQRKALFGQV